MPSRNIGVFVDAVEQYRTVNFVYKKRKLDYGKYLERASEQGTIYRAIAYGAQVNSEAYTFISCLKALGYEPNYIQVDQIIDVNRSMDIIKDIGRLLDRLDIVVIGSSNPIFAPIIDLLKVRGIKVIVFSCMISPELKECADSWIEIVEEYLENKNENAKAT